MSDVSRAARAAPLGTHRPRGCGRRPREAGCAVPRNPRRNRTPLASMDGAGRIAQTIVSTLEEKVRAELARYEHPLFEFGARPASNGVEILIRFKLSEPQVHVYSYVM